MNDNYKYAQKRTSSVSQAWEAERYDPMRTGHDHDLTNRTFYGASARAEVERKRCTPPYGPSKP